VLWVGVTIKQIKNEHLQNLLVFRVWIIWGGTKKIGGSLPPNAPRGYGPARSARIYWNRIQVELYSSFRKGSTLAAFADLGYHDYCELLTLSLNWIWTIQNCVCSVLIRLCELNLTSQTFVYTWAIRNAFPFHKLLNIHFRALPKNKSQFRNKQRPEHQQRWKNTRVRLSHKLFQAMRSRPVSWQWLSGNFKLERHAGLKWRIWIMKTRQSKYSFAVAHSEVRAKPYVISTNLHT